MKTPFELLLDAARKALHISPTYSGGRPDVAEDLRLALAHFPEDGADPAPLDRNVFHATPAEPVTIYYCKANLKTGLTVRIVQGRNVSDTAGVTFSSTLAQGPFSAEMIHGNSTGKPKASGARCVLIVKNGTVIPL